VSQESADPISSDAIAQHRVVVFACGYNIVLFLVYHGGEVNMRDRSRVSMTGERDHLGRFRHGGRVVRLIIVLF